MKLTAPVLTGAFEVLRKRNIDTTDGLIQRRTTKLDWLLTILDHGVGISLITSSHGLSNVEYHDQNLQLGQE